jgi:hypothetical protein
MTLLYQNSAATMCEVRQIQLSIRQLFPEGHSQIVYCDTEIVKALRQRQLGYMCDYSAISREK